LKVGHNKTSLTIDRSTTNFFSGSPLAALTTLSFSDNVDLQRSAALAFAEITEKEVREVGRDTLDPVLYLLTSHDSEVQRAASAALGNLAVNSEYSLEAKAQVKGGANSSRQQDSDRFPWWTRTAHPTDALPKC
jgi:hypothetical protein